MLLLTVTAVVTAVTVGMVIKKGMDLTLMQLPPKPTLPPVCCSNTIDMSPSAA